MTCAHVVFSGFSSSSVMQEKRLVEVLRENFSVIL